MVIKVDGFKAVIIPPKVSAQEFKALLNWREYKNRAGLRETKGVVIEQKEAA